LKGLSTFASTAEVFKAITKVDNPLFKKIIKRKISPKPKRKQQRQQKQKSRANISQRLKIPQQTACWE
jgi:hypothetical protein